MSKIICFLIGHRHRDCEEYSPYGLEAESRTIYLSPWAMFGTKETRYICKRCSGKFWYTKGDMEWYKMNQKFIESLQAKEMIK